MNGRRIAVAVAALMPLGFASRAWASSWTQRAQPSHRASSQSGTTLWRIESAADIPGFQRPTAGVGFAARAS
jgi:hypothetical protein